MIGKMAQFSIIFMVATLLLPTVTSQHDKDNNVVDVGQLMEDIESGQLSDLEGALAGFESLGVAARNTRFSEENLDGKFYKIHNAMMKILDYIDEQVQSPEAATKFIELGGLQKVIAQNIKFNNELLKSRLLHLTKVLFHNAHNVTSAYIPTKFLDIILDILLEDDKVDLKPLAIEILHLWLPNNPKIQARVMKLKGLIPFYNQMSVLDTFEIKNLLDLFNKILIEHVNVRHESKMKTLDAEKRKYYQRTGLIELMRTSITCGGLLNIYDISWHYNTADNSILLPVFETMKIAKQFCLKYYRGNEKAVKIFNAFEDYLNNENNLEYLEKKGINVLDVKSIVKDYVDHIVVKDEL